MLETLKLHRFYVLHTSIGKTFPMLILFKNTIVKHRGGFDTSKTSVVKKLNWTHRIYCKEEWLNQRNSETNNQIKLPALTSSTIKCFG